MSKRRKKQNVKRDASVGFLLSGDAYTTLCGDGYTPLNKNPEVVTACGVIAELIASMTIYLMCNTDNGDIRIKNELSKKLDINPNRFMTRHTWVKWIVMNMLLGGKGNAVVYPTTDDGILGDMILIPPSQTSFLQDGYGYQIGINGRYYDPDNVLHFVYNPDENYPWKGRGITVELKDVAQNLKQASDTKNAFMSNKFQPSLIVKVDASVEEFQSPEGREKLLEDYTAGVEQGRPWMLPGEMIDIKEIRPLTLGDLALNDSVVLDKKTVASIVGIPAFLLGVGNYNKDEYNNFISRKIKAIAEEIEQELSRKLLISPNWYWKFNVQSLYAYDIKTISDVYSNLYVRGLFTGNEVRDKLGASPMEGLDELVLLENYIPLDKIGDQKKLIQEGDTDGN